MTDSCAKCKSDLQTLRSSNLPEGKPTWPKLRIADLFAGCGGLSIGMQEAAHALRCTLDIKLAVDTDPMALEVYKKTFPDATVYCDMVEKLLNGDMDVPETPEESRLRCRVGQLDILMGGPPCQGHSNLNNHSRRDDPRNALYLRIASAACILKPKVVITENVPTVTLDARGAVHQTIDNLKDLGYTVGKGVVDLRKLGVPQKRRRHVIVAVRDCDIDPQALVNSLATPVCEHIPRSVRWAISDLVDVVPSKPFDKPSQPQRANKDRINWLFDHGEFNLPSQHRPDCHGPNHNYPAVYGRMSWDEPSLTVTTGFNCMGQGRYVHPARRRTITPHEAARLQMIPDYVDLGSVLLRTRLAKLIGNAVPPPLSYALGQQIIPALVDTDSDLK